VRTVDDDIAARHNITLLGPAEGQPILFAHGFGCDQSMWRYVAPRFAEGYRVVLFDHVGAGGSDLAAYDVQRYSALQGYAEDVLDICRALDLRDVIFVGHSVSSMIGVLAAADAPELFARLVLVAPSPKYIDESPYVGGFSTDDIRELLDSLESNYLGWSTAMAPVIMGADHPDLGEELTESFCRTDPGIARHFAGVTFMSDNRTDLARVWTPTLVLQCSNDVIAPVSVGEFVRDHMPNATMVLLDATGHCPNLSAPDQTATAIEQYLMRASLTTS
jgi:sigma-B regulation protein RsbQ